MHTWKFAYRGLCVGPRDETNVGFLKIGKKVEKLRVILYYWIKVIFVNNGSEYFTKLIREVYLITFHKIKKKIRVQEYKL